MAIYGYTKNFNLIKPQFDTDTWHDYEYKNLDTIDALISSVMNIAAFRGPWENNTQYNVGDVVVDTENGEMYFVVVEHMTPENTSFSDFYQDHSEYYSLYSTIDLAREWASKMDGTVTDTETTDYSSKAYAISEGLIPEMSAKEHAELAKNYSESAADSEASASVSAMNAKTSEENADADAATASLAIIKSRIWATGSDPEVQELEANEHSSRTYSNMAMAIANAPEDVPILESQLLATDVIKGEKGDKGDAWTGGDVTENVTFKGIDNHPVNIEAMAGTTSSGLKLTDSLGAGESCFDQYNTGDRYGTKIRNKNNITGKTVDLDLYQTNAGKSVLDLSDINTILAPQLLDMIYPIGSYYLSEESTCPLSEWMDECEFEIVATQVGDLTVNVFRRIM